MGQFLLDEKNYDYINTKFISLTAYKSFILFARLLNSSVTKEQVIELFKQNPMIAKQFSKDTVRIVINTLKACGCDITKPSADNGYKYELIRHPFGLKITKKQIKILQEVRKNILSLGDWQLVLKINDLYSTIAKCTYNDEIIEYMKEIDPFSVIGYDILSDVINFCARQKTVTLKYNSSRNGNEEITIVCSHITCENEHLYLWGYNFKYNKISYLRMDRILKIMKVHLEKNDINLNVQNIIYKIFGNTIKTYIQAENESIIKESEFEVMICAKVENEFNFLQRIILMSPDCEVLEPLEFRQKVVNYLKSVNLIYQNE